MPNALETVRQFGCIKAFRDDVVAKIKALNIQNLGTSVYADRVSKICPDEDAVCIVTTNNVSFKDNRSSPRFYIAEGDLVVLVYGRSFYDGETSGMSSDGDVFDFLYDAAENIIEELETKQMEWPRTTGHKPFNLKLATDIIKTKLESGTTEPAIPMYLRPSYAEEKQSGK